MIVFSWVAKISLVSCLICTFPRHHTSPPSHFPAWHFPVKTFPRRHTSPPVMMVMMMMMMMMMAMSMGMLMMMNR